MKYYLAIDIGASSGRHIVGWMEDGALRTQEVYRFPNGVEAQDGHLTWDLASLTAHIRTGIDAALAQFGAIESLAIDTWGIDYVLMRGDEPVLPCHAYRDLRTERAIPAVHALVPFEEMYRRTGCQFQPFTSVYQLFDDKQRGRLAGVTDVLMMPAYFSYTLCGVKATEYTNATTTGLISADTGDFDRELLTTLELPAEMFPPIRQPGAVLGRYKGIRVMLCASHDTASAVDAIPMEGEGLYISSGTWSLLGTRTAKPVTTDASRQANYANEGGVGYNRLQKNIMGLWLINELRRELCPDKPFTDIAAEAASDSFDALVDVNDPCFISPKSMKAAFDRLLVQKPQTDAGYFRCAYRSLAAGYRQAIDELEGITGKTYEKLYIVGGGAKNVFLNELTRAATGKNVIALPMEATAMGNLMIQMRCDK